MPGRELPAADLARRSGAWKDSLLGKMPGDHWQKRANLRAFLAYMWAHPGKQLLFMGSEFGQESEWSEGRSLDWWLLDQPDHDALSRLVTDLNAVYRSSPALWSLDTEPAGFEWIDANDAGGNTLSLDPAGLRGRGGGLRGQLQRGPAPRLPGGASGRRHLVR